MSSGITREPRESPLGNHLGNHPPACPVSGAGNQAGITGNHYPRQVIPDSHPLGGEPESGPKSKTVPARMLTLPCSSGGTRLADADRLAVSAEPEVVAAFASAWAAGGRVTRRLSEAACAVAAALQTTALLEETTEPNREG